MVIRDLLTLWDRSESVKILSHYLMTTPGHLYAHLDEPVVHKVEELFYRAVALRKKGYPLQYILGTWDFFTLQLKMKEGVLIPRPETECLVELALEIAGKNSWEEPHVLDVGFGTGAIALAVQKHLPHARVTGVDISRNALQIAKENARSLGLEAVRFLEGDLFSAVPGEKFHMILSNPPYLSTEDADSLQQELTFEPPLALFAGTEGLDIYRRLIPEARHHLHANGYVIVEIGAVQAEDVSSLFLHNDYSEITVHKDLAGWDRLISARYGG